MKKVKRKFIETIDEAKLLVKKVVDVEKDAVNDEVISDESLHF